MKLRVLELTAGLQALELSIPCTRNPSSAMSENFRKVLKFLGGSGLEWQRQQRRSRRTRALSPLPGTASMSKSRGRGFRPWRKGSMDQHRLLQNAGQVIAVCLPLRFGLIGRPSVGNS